MKKSVYYSIACLLAAGVILFYVISLLGKAEDTALGTTEAEIKEDIIETDLFQGPEKMNRIEEESLSVPIDFLTWKDRNPDVYAWIRISDTNVDYPILQGGPNDSYYLDHTIDGVKGYPGSIYTERVNAKDFCDFNTVIYGHNMKDGSMFKHLHKFEEKEFFDSHEFFEIYTEEGTILYRIYAAVVYSDKHIMHAFDYADVEGRKAYIESLDTGESKNHLREGMKIDEDSKLVTLATCIGGRPNNRWLVIGERIEY